MSSYIDKDRLRSAMYQEAFINDSNLQKWDGGCWIRYKLFEKVLESMPDADVEEVNRGRWISWHQNRVMCSECKLEPYAGKGADSFKYCPHCGAKMEVPK